MGSSKLKVLAAVSLIGLLPVTATVAQGLSGIRVTGAELEAWFAADQMAVAGIGSNNCHWIAKGTSRATLSDRILPQLCRFHCHWAGASARRTAVRKAHVPRREPFRGVPRDFQGR